MRNSRDHHLLTCLNNDAVMQVVGSLLGQSGDRGSNAGQAKGASITFMDLQPAAVSDSVQLRPPPDLDQDYLSVLRSEAYPRLAHPHDSLLLSCH